MIIRLLEKPETIRKIKDWKDCYYNDICPICRKKCNSYWNTNCTYNQKYFPKLNKILMDLYKNSLGIWSKFCFHDSCINRGDTFLIEEFEKKL